jgi:hypothetical protein
VVHPVVEWCIVHLDCGYPSRLILGDEDVVWWRPDRALALLAFIPCSVCGAVSVSLRPGVRQPRIVQCWVQHCVLDLGGAGPVPVVFRVVRHVVIAGHQHRSAFRVCFVHQCLYSFPLPRGPFLVLCPFISKQLTSLVQRCLSCWWIINILKWTTLYNVYSTNVVQRCLIIVTKNVGNVVQRCLKSDHVSDVNNVVQRCFKQRCTTTFANSNIVVQQCVKKRCTTLSEF